MRAFHQAVGIGLILAAITFAQEGPQFTFDVGYGFTTPVGNTGRHLDEGWNLQGGAGYNFSPWVGVKLNLGYNSFAVNSGTLSKLGVSGGSVNVFSTTLDPVVHLTRSGVVDVYITGGGGFFHREQEFTQPTVAIVDSFFGFYPYPVALSATQVLASSSVNKPGVDGGVGIEFGTGHGKMFLEAKYDRIFVGNSHTDYLPVTAGFRW